jgi:serine/threonine-protein kinase
MLTGTSPFVADNIHGVMYQTMNFNPPAPKTLNPELPDMLNFIIAKALAKNLDDRYQLAKDLCDDLRQAIAALAGESASPDIVARASNTPFVQPVSPLTRQEDKEARILGMADNRAVAESEAQLQDEPSPEIESSHPALGLSKAFDSFDATMRLAALTGMEKGLDKFSETQKIARLKALADAKRSAASAAASTLSGSATWQNMASGAQKTNPSPMPLKQLKLIWICSALMAVAAATLFLLH